MKYHEQVVGESGTHTMAVGFAGWTEGVVILGRRAFLRSSRFPDVCESCRLAGIPDSLRFRGLDRKAARTGGEGNGVDGKDGCVRDLDVT